jgi:hypothetical protein
VTPTPAVPGLDPDPGIARLDGASYLVTVPFTDFRYRGSDTEHEEISA